MRNNRAPLVVAILLGFSIVLQTGCKKGKEPGTATNPKSEIFNIKYAIKKAESDFKKENRIAKLRSAYEAAGELSTRWPNAPAIDQFSKETAGKLSQIPETIYDLSMEVNDLEAFKWALSQGVEINTDASALMTFWSLGPQWRDFILADYPERALPLYMNAAMGQKDVEFFNAHIEAFKASGYMLCPPLETATFYSKYCRFLAEQFAAAMEENHLERIRLLLTYMPHYSDAGPLYGKTVFMLKRLGDYLFYEQKDEALATTFIELHYPLNRIDLSRTEFSSGFMKALTADPAYAIAALQLDLWHGPLSRQETLFLIALSPEALQAVDQQYIDETVKLCLRKNKNKLAIKLIKARSLTHPLTGEDYDKMLSWAIQTGNNDFFKYVLKERDDMDLHQVNLVELAANYDMFVKYAPRILSHISKNEDDDTYEPPAAFEAMSEVIASTNHAAGAYLIKKYDLARKWENRPGEHSLLMEVCLAGNLPAAKYLIETKNQDPEERTHYVSAGITEFGRSDPKEGNLNLIHLAAKSGNSALIEYLASKNVSVNDRSYFGATPLMYAVSHGHLEATKTLLSLGANVNTTMKSSLKAEPMPERGSYKQLSTAYRRAQHGNHDEILELLKNAGARP